MMRLLLSRQRSLTHRPPRGFPTLLHNSEKTALIDEQVRPTQLAPARRRASSTIALVWVEQPAQETQYLEKRYQTTIIPQGREARVLPDRQQMLLHAQALPVLLNQGPANATLPALRLQEPGPSSMMSRQTRRLPPSIQTMAPHHRASKRRQYSGTATVPAATSQNPR